MPKTHFHILTTDSENNHFTKMLLIKLETEINSVEQWHQIHLKDTADEMSCKGLYYVYDTTQHIQI